MTVDHIQNIQKKKKKKKTATFNGSLNQQFSRRVDKMIPWLEK
jgi:hypothetical protein